MDMTGTHQISAPREVVWAALNDVDILRICIPGCEEIEQTTSTTLNAKIVQKIGPVKARFETSIELSNIVVPEGYTITGEGKGGVAGFAKGGADVVLIPDGLGTILNFDVKVQVGGKLARLGGRLLDSTAKKIATQFFDNFQKHLCEESDFEEEQQIS